MKNRKKINLDLAMDTLSEMLSVWTTSVKTSSAISKESVENFKSMLSLMSKSGGFAYKVGKTIESKNVLAENIETDTVVIEVEKPEEIKYEHSCNKCGSTTKAKKALVNELVTSEDFIGETDTRGSTQSRIGKAKLVDALQCANHECGHTFVPEEWVKTE